MKEAGAERRRAARGASRAGVHLGASEQRSARRARAADGPPDLNCQPRLRRLRELRGDAHLSAHPRPPLEGRTLLHHQALRLDVAEEAPAGADLDAARALDLTSPIAAPDQPLRLDDRSTDRRSL